MTAPNINIKEILTAATPIVETVSSMVNKAKSEKVDKRQTPNINVTIHNHFYVISEKDAMVSALKIREQVVDAIGVSDTNYIV